MYVFSPRRDRKSEANICPMTQERGTFSESRKREVAYLTANILPGTLARCAHTQTPPIPPILRTRAPVLPTLSTFLHPHFIIPLTKLSAIWYQIGSSRGDVTNDASGLPSSVVIQSGVGTTYILQYGNSKTTRKRSRVPTVLAVGLIYWKRSERASEGARARGKREKSGHVLCPRLLTLCRRESLAALDLSKTQKAAAQANCSNRPRISITQSLKNTRGEWRTSGPEQRPPAWCSWPGSTGSTRPSQARTRVRRKTTLTRWSSFMGSTTGKPGSTTPVSCRRRFSAKRRVVTLS